MLSVEKYTNLSTVEMISIRWIEDSSVLIYRIYFSVHYIEITVVSQLKGSRHRESIHPRKLSIKEVTGDVQVLVTPPQLHHITATAGRQAVCKDTAIKNY